MTSTATALCVSILMFVSPTAAWQLSPPMHRREILLTPSLLPLLPLLPPAASASASASASAPVSASSSAADPPPGFEVFDPSKYGVTISSPITPPIYQKIIAAGTGDDRPRRAQKVKVNYELRLNSFLDRIVDKSTGVINQPLKVAAGVGSVIKGWDYVLLSMLPGEKRYVIIPPEYGYGSIAQGGILQGIPPNSKLYFVIELVEVEEFKMLNDEQVKWLDANPL